MSFRFTLSPLPRYVIDFVCTCIVGCFVPAAKARIAPVDAIYSRMGANDFIFANASTFKVEMDDCNKILTKVSCFVLLISLRIFHLLSLECCRQLLALSSFSMNSVEELRLTTVWRSPIQYFTAWPHTWDVLDSSQLISLLSPRTLP